MRVGGLWSSSCLMLIAGGRNHAVGAKLDDFDQNETLRQHIPGLSLLVNQLPVQAPELAAKSEQFIKLGAWKGDVGLKEALRSGAWKPYQGFFSFNALTMVRLIIRGSMLPVSL